MTACSDVVSCFVLRSVVHLGVGLGEFSGDMGILGTETQGAQSPLVRLSGDHLLNLVAVRRQSDALVPFPSRCCLIITA